MAIVVAMTVAIMADLRDGGRPGRGARRVLDAVDIHGHFARTIVHPRHVVPAHEAQRAGAIAVDDPERAAVDREAKGLACGGGGSGGSRAALLVRGC